MKIRIFLMSIAALIAVTGTSLAGPRVQVVIGGFGGCAPIIYQRPVCATPVFVRFYRPAPVVYYQPTIVVPSGVFLSQPPIVTSAPQRGVYRAPIVPVNAIRTGGGFTWQR